ncbi:hypothetical protein Caci_0222 [Catenulispora acidiphila DSM 44928]|uniref:Uncharacterized protein n=1 Tax=Catenulispora acidiphila (strain DSM 44928 / JCM 14897 / NBRC 102108 / NRRL B-24433 / ID139908) TaxID=479433 RepID=C7QJ33_CATAD|nr:hypothetical protein [Catenulispora acidiphila]ACU69175.1 hypothetical protein Caci_0222 [Catenulispora acidiphila DSM 44928]
MTHFQSATPPTASGSHSTPPTPGWLSVGAERADPQDCSEGGCVGDYSAPTDLFCRKHDRFLPLSSRLPSRRKTIAINLSRLVVLGGFEYSAQYATNVPLVVLGAVLGGLLLVLPLRRFPHTYAAAVRAWAVGGLVCGLAAIPDVTLHRVLGTAVLVIVLGGATLYLGRLASLIGVGDPRIPDQIAPRRAARQHAGRQAALGTPGRVAGLVVGPAVASPAAILTLLALGQGPAQWLFRAPSAIQVFLVTTAIGGPVATLFIAAVAGFLEGAPKVDRQVAPKFPEPFAPPRFVLDTVPDGSLGRVASRTVEITVNAVRRAAHVLATSTVRTANWMHRHAVIIGRKVAATAQCALGILRNAAVIAGYAAMCAVRIVVLPAVGIGAAYALLVPSGSALTRYLLSGGFADLGLGIAGAIALAASVMLVWMLLSGLSRDRVLDSATHNVEDLWARVMVLIATGGLALGTLGSLGYGKIHIGFVTLSVDAVVAFTVLKGYARTSIPWRRNVTK